VHDDKLPKFFLFHADCSFSSLQMHDI
jgi:hypothetical protein